jgi:site-specific DNA recombinase
MKHVSIATKRCAVYTRKSTDHNLDLAFNSLDAQREACEAYIKSQAHEGWQLLAGKYDDGAFSGASLDRPALQDLLDHVRANKIDIVVVYKVDRLTRSLTDFAKLVELFDTHNVSFVSITQSFNTTSSMGRLTLNVLLSFAQFEREVIGERVRDKIAASKRKGLWVGGPVPLGYKVVDKKPYVDAEEAKTVQTIFEAYLRIGSITGLAAELYRLGIKPKERAGKSGRLLSAERFQPGALVYLLRNRFYVGEVSYKGQVFAGEHEPLLARDLFDAVQSRLNEQRVDKKVTSKKTNFTLAGKIFDDRDNLMAPSHANKKGVRYRYYVSRALLEGRKSEAGLVARVSAPDVETIVNDAVADLHSAESPSVGRAALHYLIRKVVVMQDRIDITVDKDDASESMTISRPFVSAACVRKGVVDQNKKLLEEPEQRRALLKAITSARKWMALIIDGKSDIRALALEINLTERHFRYLLSLAYLSPKMVEAIADGTAPGSWTASNIARNLPLRWSEQERLLQPAS